MKKHLIPYLLLIVTSLFSCEGESPEPVVQTIVGEWELESATNGMTGNSSAYPVGNGNILKFSGSNYERYDKGQIIADGSYSIIKDSSILDKKVYDRILYDNNTNSMRVLFKFIDNKLFMWIDGYDPPSMVYYRKSASAFINQK